MTKNRKIVIISIMLGLSISLMGLNVFVFREKMSNTSFILSMISLTSSLILFLILLLSAYKEN